MRLNKYISESGLCSRREADKLIANGKVYINGQLAKIGVDVAIGDVVRVNGRTLEARTADDLVLIALNKPVGVTSTTEAGVKDNIVDYVNHSQRIFPIGRLDKDSQGLILLTNEGDLVNKILRAGNKHEKEYIVTVNKPISEEVLSKMSMGVPMLGVMTKKCKIVQESPTKFRITLIQGLNRQIRRMCEHFGFEVTKLERIRIMHIELKGLPLGEWRELSSTELTVLFDALQKSQSEVKSIPNKSAKPASKSNTKPSSKTFAGKPTELKSKQSKPFKRSATSKSTTAKKQNNQGRHKPKRRRR
jgi:23S rRNA pseudouridine2604 synthase